MSKQLKKEERDKARIKNIGRRINQKLSGYSDYGYNEFSKCVDNCIDEEYSGKEDSECNCTRTDDIKKDTLYKTKQPNEHTETCMLLDTSSPAEESIHSCHSGMPTVKRIGRRINQKCAQDFESYDVAVMKAETITDKTTGLDNLSREKQNNLDTGISMARAKRQNALKSSYNETDECSNIQKPIHRNNTAKVATHVEQETKQNNVNGQIHLDSNKSVDINQQKSTNIDPDSFVHESDEESLEKNHGGDEESVQQREGSAAAAGNIILGNAICDKQSLVTTSFAFFGLKPSTRRPIIDSSNLQNTSSILIKDGKRTNNANLENSNGNSSGMKVKKSVRFEDDDSGAAAALKQVLAYSDDEASDDT